MKYGFLTTLIPEEMEEEVRRCSKHNMQDAANALQWNLFEGFQRNIEEDVRLINVLPIGSFPQYYSRPYINTSIFDTKYNQGNCNIGFCNIKLLRNYHQVSRIYRELKKWCSEDGEKTLFVYTASAPFMKAVSRLKRYYHNIRVCVVIADLPELISLSDKISRIRHLYIRHNASISYRNLIKADAFVLLTKHMAEYLKTDKPWMVMEGIAGKVAPCEHIATDKKIILYTGTLHSRFGVRTLVDAFMQITGEEYRLVLCGVGDSEQYIRVCAEKDDRIVFKGQVAREEALQLQQQATVLVNPRQNNEEFTKYSFPSKTMEYLASGVPVVAYKLDGIPDEYDDYLNYVEDNSAESLAAKLVEICNLDKEAHKAMGKRGAEFVLQNKNARVQTRRILEFIGKEVE